MNILISGAGIAGPALAYWLREYGFAVTVVERAPALRLGGQAVDLRGTAREVVSRMGLLDEIRARHTGVVGVAAVDERNRRLYEWGAQLSGDSGGIIADIEILRGDLGQLFHDASRDGVEYLFGDAIAALDSRDDGVDVRFDSGGRRTFDLVVGADGVHSRVRRLVFGPEREWVADRGFFKCVFEAPVGTGSDGLQTMYSMPGGRRASVYPVRGRGARNAVVPGGCRGMGSPGRGGSEGPGGADFRGRGLVRAAADRGDARRTGLLPRP
ncbi:2-polyprenyl-6-methoxyphenol hydroxylase-like FAD-dependent oxidoreductase [Amycolatopsis endophytica]|uniref:2-polyprenyl-6-methoxyphenol hydroxylase-like FAD-dependent oxidoreductase n=1 Tax=Amycolatopsis endophytica TaxID=860233 RepID=A0A853B5V6_9PSEU|nr:FAD-dependent monooxygenase [Amycolatopsis endophytica]NYI89936.1 2-polyprenyl-6-methoxyphenol hydroxylase-like FAD-dependent oxidoreductase [Amycolatopsis endophytica]